MSQSGDPDELFEVARNELRTVVRDDSRLGGGELLQGTLQDDFDILFCHGATNFMMDNCARTAVEHRAKIVEGSANVEVADIGMPVLMRLERLNKSGSLFGRFAIPPLEQTSLLQHPISRGRADRDDIVIQHHKSKPAISFQRVLLIEVDDGILFPGIEPMIPRNEAVVFVDFSISLSPIVELGPRHPQPANNLQGPQGGALRRPAMNEIDDRVAHIVRGPDFRYSSPSSFFKTTCSCINSASASLRICSLASNAAMRS